MNRYFYPILFFVLLTPLNARAECVNPPAEMGVIIFNKDHKVMQYCNGDDWVGLWGGGGGSGGGLPTCSNGEIAQFTNGKWECNDGSALDNLNATNLKSGTVPVARLGTSGTRNNTTYLRGDNTWAAPSASATLGQNSCQWVNAHCMSGHSCPQGATYAGICPSGKYVAGLSLTTWGSAATYNHQIYCCSP